ncbi:hypothetical protein BDZ85DRAFT_106309 [Elsinoe ampelina]|uniref:Uncharacterized protein n=1 Tax=Elsinoe ampelina TaxID=302913 RepID=A0A6A6FY69_9PEZI|nr:hypothetical protein BDZ85DRAFT_106309 [Elsinoe ampelina]
MRSISLLLPWLALVSAQSLTSSDGYVGYNLEVTGDGESAAYETANTDTNNNTAYTPPDVFLNATASVGEISIGVQNLSAKINVDAQVLGLLNFGAGVDLSINRVDLIIQNVSARVLLEARLGNLVTMIDDVLDSIDLNPLLVSLGRTLENVADGVGDALDGALGGGSTGSGSGSGASNLTARSVQTVLDEPDNILYSVNDYSGDTHTNRKLENNGDIVDQFLDNDGRVRSQTTVGSYATDFTFTGQENEVVVDGQTFRSREYTYKPFIGLNIVSYIYFDADDTVVKARVFSEGSAGGTSTISN